MSEQPLPQPAVVLHDDSLDEDTRAAWAGGRELGFRHWRDREQLAPDSRVLLWLSDAQIRELAPIVLERQWAVAVLPHPDAAEAGQAMGVRGDPEQLLDYYALQAPLPGDALTCNGDLVFSSVVIGSTASLSARDDGGRSGDLRKVLGALRGLPRLSLEKFRLTTSSGKQVKLAALGMVAIGHTRSSMVGRRFEDRLSTIDGRVSLLALAPRSVLAYLWFLWRLLLPGKLRMADMGGALALVQSDAVTLEGDGELDYLLDGEKRQARRLELQVAPERLQLLAGPEVELPTGQPGVADKERLRLGHVPVDEAADVLAGRPLPTLSRATESEYRDLFIALRENATPTLSYQVLMMLSVMLALIGLYADSAPVIIGAMILAPMMAPVISLAMGLARSNSTLLKDSLGTLVVGIGWGLACGALVALALPFDTPTPQMQYRMSPTLLDLVVAILSGVAGAYAHAREEIAKSLAGVAIAVALVPPLAVVGIGLGWGDWHMAQGALLLLATNLVGISLAASLTFLAMGFAPFERARAGLLVSLVLVALVSVPLYVAYDTLVQGSKLKQRVPVGELTLLDQSAHVGQVRVVPGEPALVQLVVSSPERLENRHLDELKRMVGEQVGQPVVLEAELHIRR